jgi:hypothetical protein
MSITKAGYILENAFSNSFLFVSALFFGIYEKQLQHRKNNNKQAHKSLIFEQTAYLQKIFKEHKLCCFKRNVAQYRYTRDSVHLLAFCKIIEKRDYLFAN